MEMHSYLFQNYRSGNFSETSQYPGGKFVGFLSFSTWMSCSSVCLLVVLPRVTWDVGYRFHPCLPARQVVSLQLYFVIGQKGKFLKYLQRNFLCKRLGQPILCILHKYGVHKNCVNGIQELRV